MNNNVMKAALLAAFGVAAIAPLAASAATNTSTGTVSISGTIVTSTCNVNSPTVVLPTVDTGTLAAINSTAGWTSVTITLTGCSSVTGATKVFPYFSGSNINTSSGFLNNAYTAGTASNVQVALSNGQSAASGTALTLQNASGYQNVTAQALPTSGTSNINFNFYAGYVAATAAATAGGVSTTVQYDLNYQ
jgi:major type 1 subunit fimbrin (pilin)